MSSDFQDIHVLKTNLVLTFIFHCEQLSSLMVIKQTSSQVLRQFQNCCCESLEFPGWLAERGSGLFKRWPEVRFLRVKNI